MDNKKSLTLTGLTVPHSLYLLLSIGMIGVSAYLTNHFYQISFPDGFNTADTLCNINNYFNCDHTTKSALGQIFNVPTAFFGIIIGILGIIGAIFSSEKMESTNKFFIYLNAIGCFILFVFSLVILKHLCPFCTVYYVLSWSSAFLFYKYSDYKPVPNIPVTAIYGVLVIIPSIFMYNHFQKKEGQLVSLSSSYILQYQGLNVIGDPVSESPFKIIQSTSVFADAPIRISVFSDFECPFCKVVSEQMHELMTAFPGKINIQYFPYPLDNACNTNITRVFHRFACKAAFLATCDKTQFAKLHDIVFARQADLNDENLEKWQKEFGLTGCFDNVAVKDDIQTTIMAAEQYSLKSTPTIIINGKKIEGTIPTMHFKAILKTLLK